MTYINLGTLVIENFEGMADRLKKSKSIICDLRGYPSGGIHKMLSHFLKEKDTAKGYMKIPLNIRTKKILAPIRPMTYRAIKTIFRG